MIAPIRLKDHWSEQRLFLARVIAAAVIILALVTMVALRLLHLQVFSYEHFTSLSQGNRVRIEPLPPTRGLIFDRQGKVLAENLPTYQLELTREEVLDLPGTLERLERMGLVREQDRERIREQLRAKRKFDAVALRYQLSDQEVALFAVNRQSFPGVDIRARLIRHYPYGPEAVHAIGYVGAISEQDASRIDAADYAGTTHIGKLGIEKQYENLLHGKAGYRQVLVNAQGRQLQTLFEELPTPGQNLSLNLDIDLQMAANAALGERRGAVVAIEPGSGEVLVFASTPGFDPNRFAAGLSREEFLALQNDIDKPLFNRALRGQYPPGSTIKPIMGLSGMHFLGRNPAEKRNCPGFFTLPGHSHRYRDWKKQGHGRLDMVESIAESCDIYFYELAVELGIDRMHESMTEFGIGVLSGIDVPGEKKGLMPSREWKRRAYSRRADQVWFPGETVITGIGQGFMLTTPLQLAQATAIIASQGQRFVPRLLRETEDPVSGEIRASEPESLPGVTLGDPFAWQQVHTGMVAVLHGSRGTARASAQGASFRFAGKTGTAQVFSVGQEDEYDEEEVDERLRHHALFIAFAPVAAPEIAIAVIVENGGGGSRTAAPVARQVLDFYFSSKEP